jgi:hypothetical protein
METTVVIIVSVTLLAILGSIYLEIRRQIKPKIKIYFPDGSTQMRYRAKEESNIAIHIKNTGTLGFPKPAATEIVIFVYMPLIFSPTKLQYSQRASTIVLKAPTGGLFSNMQYLAIGDIVLFHKEEEVITLSTQLPEATGKYPVKVAILSDQGDLGVHQLDISVC